MSFSRGWNLLGNEDARTSREAELRGIGDIAHEGGDALAGRATDILVALRYAIATNLRGLEVALTEGVRQGCDHGILA